MSNVYSVFEINEYIKRIFSQDFMLKNVCVQGEISGFKANYSSGHVYFTLKDEKSAIGCMIYKNQWQAMGIDLKDGDRVVLTGSVSVYTPSGSYKIIASKVALAGYGALYERLEKLKQKLEKEGKFSQEHKKPLKTYPERVGVVTSATGAVIRDIKNVLTRRNPGIQLILYPCAVQGEGAWVSIATGIRTLEKENVDTIIVGRGGGSVEDLWPFNEEGVVNAIYECSVPIISAVGHETDTTLCDFAADLRAPTPSAAAELCTLDIFDAVGRIEGYREHLSYILAHFINTLRDKLLSLKRLVDSGNPEKRLNEYRERVKSYKKLLDLKGPLNIIPVYKERLRSKGFFLDGITEGAIKEKRNILDKYLERLDGLSPSKRLGAGYSFVSDMNNRGINSVKQVKIGDSLFVSLKDGQIITKVEKRKENEGSKEY